MSHCSLISSLIQNNALVDKRDILPDVLLPRLVYGSAPSRAPGSRRQTSMKPRAEPAYRRVPVYINYWMVQKITWIFQQYFSRRVSTGSNTL